MTCTVGLVRGGKMWMGADSAVSSGPESIDLIGPGISKVFKKTLPGGEECLIGFSGDPRFAQIIEHSMQLPVLSGAREDSGKVMGWLVTAVVPWAKKVLREEGLMAVKDGVAFVSSGFLIGVRNRFYEIRGTLGVNALADPFGAIGSGRSEALGVFFAAEKLGFDVDPEKLVQTALAAAERWTPNVRGPFQIISS